MSVRGDYYKVASGWNNTAGLATLSPQPRTRPMGLGRRQKGGDGHVYVDGFASTVLYFDAMTRAQLNNLLSTQFGFSATALSVEVTIRLRSNHDRAFRNYNAIAHYPDFPDEGEESRYIWRDVRIQITHIEPIDAGGGY